MLPRAPLGSTRYSITRTGLGAWAIGGGEWQGGWGPQDDDDSVRTIHHAVERGINWVDTAPAYGLGRSEAVVGRALRGLRDAERPLVFTKCGLVWREGERTVSNVLAPASIRRECESSLRRLGVERLDLLQIHWPSHDGTPLEESWSTMAALVDDGLVSAIGVSNFDTAMLERCEAIRHVDTVQPPLNLIETGALDGVIPWAHAHGTGVIVYSPMASGLLSGSFTRARVEALPHDDWRRSNAEFQEPLLTRNLAVAGALRAVAERHATSVPAVAVAWTLHQTGVTAAIVGARRPEQVDGWIDAASLRLDEADLDVIRSARSVASTSG